MWRSSIMDPAVRDSPVLRPTLSSACPPPLLRIVGVLFFSTAVAVPLTACADPDPGAGNETGTLPQRANAAWIYDPEATGPSRERNLKHGAYADLLTAYNRRSESKHNISLLYTFGGSTELYCERRGTPEQHCDPEDMVVTYEPRGDAHRTARAYRKNVATRTSEGPVISPVIDGVVNADYPGSMKGFNELSREEAGILADKVSELVCSDPEVDGIQFDIEPFNVEEKNGQYHFYMRIASNFAGATGEFGCVDEKRPDGRFFSIFTTARRIRPGSESARNVAEILHAHDNGYLVGALYDLGGGPPGTQTPLEEYRRLVRAETRNMYSWAKKLDIPYQHGIPAAAGYHEYERCRGPECAPRERGPRQLDYARVALEAIHDQPETDRFLGVTLWSIGPDVTRNETEFGPSKPSIEVLEYISGRLGRQGALPFR